MGRYFLLIFFLVNLALASFFLDTAEQSPNPTSRVLPVIALYDYGTLCIDSLHEVTIDKSVVDGHYFSDKAPLPTFMVIPIYGGLKALGLVGNYRPLVHRPVYLLGGFFCASLPFALIITLLFRYLPRGRLSVNPVWLATLPLFGSFVFIYTGTFYGHVLAAIFTLAAYLMIRYRRQFFWAGMLAGLAFLSDFPIGLLLPVWAAQLYFNEKNWQPALTFVAGFVPALAMIMVYNTYTTGSPITFLYQMVAHEDFAKLSDTIGFQYPHPEALWGMIFGQYRGLLFYLPILGLAAWYLIRSGKYTNPLRHYLWGFVLLHLVVISSHAIWWGGWSFGPRHLVAPGVLLAFEAVRWLAYQGVKPIAFFAVTGFGLFITFLAKATVQYSIPTEEDWPVFGYLFKKLGQGVYNEHNLLSSMMGLDPKISIFVWLGLFFTSLYVMARWYRRINPQQLAE